MPRAIISSGHTSQDPGTQSHDLVEYEIARKIAKAVVPVLRQHGVITLAVPADLDLIKRIDWVNRTNYDESSNDVAIEIHINEGGKSGIESWYEGEGESKSKQLSELLLKHTSQESGLPEQGARSEYDHEIGSIAFLHDVNAITALIECGYIDNETDAKFLKEDKNIEKLAKGIAKGVLEYFGIEFRDTGVSPISQPITPTTTPKTFPSIPPSPANPATVSTTSPTAFPKTPRPTPGLSQDYSAGFDQSSPFPLDNDFGGAGTKPSGFMSREDRKKMIEEKYVKILGREPNQNDLNYFINTGINEQELIKKMIDSQEHADLVKARQEVIKAKDELNDTKTELIALRTSTEDQKVIIRNLHTLIAQKNQALAQMQQQLGVFHEQKNKAVRNNVTQAPQPQHKYKGTFLDKVFKAFSDVFE